MPTASRSHSSAFIRSASIFASSIASSLSFATCKALMRSCKAFFSSARRLRFASFSFFSFSFSALMRSCNALFSSARRLRSASFVAFSFSFAASLVASTSPIISLRDLPALMPPGADFFSSAFFFPLSALRFAARSRIACSLSDSSRRTSLNRSAAGPVIQPSSRAFPR